VEILIYISAAKGKLDNTQIDDIRSTSLRNNERDNITGILLYGEGGFIQVLEGVPEDLTKTFARIQRDDRHQGIIELFRQPIITRSFGKWHMGIKHLKNTNEFSDLFTDKDISLDGEEVNNVRRETFTLLRTFIKVHFPNLAA